jgi:hypothetical protein
MLEHLLSHLLSRKIENRLDRWMNSGRRPDPVVALDGQRFRMAFGFRYRFRSVMTCLGFGGVFALGCWVQLAAPDGSVWFPLMCFGFLGPMSLLSAALAVHSVTAEVMISPQGFTLRSCFVNYATVDWDDIRSAYRSSVHPSLVFVTSSGRRVRISTKLDGLHAMIASLGRLRRGVADSSIVEWMISEA